MKRIAIVITTGLVLVGCGGTKPAAMTACSNWLKLSAHARLESAETILARLRSARNPSHFSDEVTALCNRPRWHTEKVAVAAATVLIETTTKGDLKTQVTPRLSRLAEADLAAVSIRPGDVPGMRLAAAAEEVPVKRSAIRFSGCIGGTNPRELRLDLSSARFKGRGAMRPEVVSEIEVWPSKAVAGQELARIETPRWRACAKRQEERETTRTGLFTVGSVRVTPHPSLLPGVRVSGERVVSDALWRGSEHTYVVNDSFAFRSGRAEIWLGLISHINEAVPERTAHRLLAALYARTQRHPL